jgi:hypothetical protein
MFLDKYQKIFKENEDYVSCDFSVLIPAWKLETSTNWNINLFNQAIDYAEQKKYYSFYKVISSDSLNEYLKYMKTNFSRYILVIEETILENEKPTNLLFWDWLFLSTSFDRKLSIVNHILSQEFRNGY